MSNFPHGTPDLDGVWICTILDHIYCFNLIVVKRLSMMVFIKESLIFFQFLPRAVFMYSFSALVEVKQCKLSQEKCQLNNTRVDRHWSGKVCMINTIHCIQYTGRYLTHWLGKLVVNNCPKVTNKAHSKIVYYFESFSESPHSSIWISQTWKSPLRAELA